MQRGEPADEPLDVREAELADRPAARPSASAETVEQGGSRLRRWPWILLALSSLAIVVMFLLTADYTVDVEQTRKPHSLQLVSIEEVTSRAETVEITSYSEVRPRWAAELRASVSGRVTEVLGSALAGERVESGTILITIENSTYVAERAAAELALKEVRLTLRQAQNATLLARKDYHRSGQKPPNDLALKLPQLEIAKSAVASANARLDAAKRRLADTRIAAPFSAYVTERFVSPGQSVNPGDRLVKLADSRKFELIVELGRNDWLLLNKPISGLTAKVLDQSRKVIAHARVRQGGGFLDEKTRQYKVFLDVGNQRPKSVLAGDFVRVILPGITVPVAMNIPASSLTQEGYVWCVNAEDILDRVSPQVLFRRQDRIVVRAPQGVRSWRVVTTPLASFLPGQKVRAKKVED